MTGGDKVTKITKHTKQWDRSYSICTLVTRKDEYLECIASFRQKGFSDGDCEYLYIDNSNGNTFDAYAGYNLFLQKASGRYIILCHQDVLLIDSDRARLDLLLLELDQTDPHWALCGNAGARDDGTFIARITDPKLGDTNTGGPFPVRTVSLDENFIVARKDANLALSRDVSGYHLYGTELCIIADILGYRSYVIDFHLLHKSEGNIDKSYEAIRIDMTAKYRHAVRPRWQYGTTGRPFYISSSPMRTWLATAYAKLKRCKTLYTELKRHIKKALRRVAPKN